LSDTRGKEARQPSASAFPDRVWDVIVIGAGPAGAVTAWSLARHGHDVLLIDKDAFPREKVCGDCLLTDTVAFLRRAGFLEDIRRLVNEVGMIVVYSPSGFAFEASGAYLTLKREVFDDYLVDKAVDAGVVFARGKAVDLVPRVPGDAVSIVLKDPPTTLRGRFCVLATGASVELAHRIGIVAERRPTAVAGRCYVQSEAGLDHAILSYDRSLVPGYGWVIPLGNGLYNIGCGTKFRRLITGQEDLKKAFQRFLSEFRPAKRLMDHGEIITDFRAAPLRCCLARTESPVKGNLVAVGETIGATLPFTCEGVGSAIETAEMAAAAVAEALRTGEAEQLNSYSRQVAAKMKPRHQGYEIAERWMAHRWLNDLMAWRVSRSRMLHERLRAFLAGATGARAVYTPWRLLQSFWR
jgi:geranylgeranyl reductase family protein